MCPQYSAESNKRDMLEELTSHLVARPSNKTFLLHDLATCISAAIDADQVRPSICPTLWFMFLLQVNLYIHSTEGHISEFNPHDNEKKYVEDILCEMMEHRLLAAGRRSTSGPGRPSRLTAPR